MSDTVWTGHDIDALRAGNTSRAGIEWRHWSIPDATYGEIDEWNRAVGGRTATVTHRPRQDRWTWTVTDAAGVQVAFGAARRRDDARSQADETLAELEKGFD